ncbi:hypothetical protein MVEN_00187600 [Mycena venus]|uniref:Uncharacterized protein n=1 Tax=Mycena venus TaxID=2733690 RepID=A0A8H7DBS5_9AGAR|nr:hypothetical protein MVEN_00187600 [Mycena venus]
MPATLLSRSWESSVLHPTKYASTSRTSQPLSAVRSPPQFQSQSQSTSGRLGTSVPPTLSNSGAAPHRFPDRDSLRGSTTAREAHISGRAASSSSPSPAPPSSPYAPSARTKQYATRGERSPRDRAYRCMHTERFPGPFYTANLMHMLMQTSHHFSGKSKSNSTRRRRPLASCVPNTVGVSMWIVKPESESRTVPPRGTGNGNEKSTQKPTRTRSRPVSGYFYRVEPEAAEEDLMPEVREALHVNARIREMGYRYERIDEDECERGLE